MTVIEHRKDEFSAKYKTMDIVKDFALGAARSLASCSPPLVGGGLGYIFGGQADAVKFGFIGAMALPATTLHWADPIDSKSMAKAIGGVTGPAAVLAAYLSCAPSTDDLKNVRLQEKIERMDSRASSPNFFAFTAK